MCGVLGLNGNTQNKSLQNKCVVILGCTGDLTSIIYNYLSREVPISKVIVEQSRTRKQIIKQKLRDYGFVATVGQILFAFTAKNILEVVAKKRKSEINNMPNMDLTPVPGSKLLHTDSVNTKACRELLREIKPDLVVVYGTRIIGEKTLQCIDASFLNIHPGITPRFRGLYTGYWAMVDNPEAVGVTVHFVDPGVDTGMILGQTTITPTSKDNLATYSLLLIQAGLPLLLHAVKNSLAGCSAEKAPMFATKSKQWSHPTLWGYVWNLIRFRVW